MVRPTGKRPGSQRWVKAPTKGMYLCRACVGTTHLLHLQKGGVDVVLGMSDKRLYLTFTRPDGRGVTMTGDGALRRLALAIQQEVPGAGVGTYLTEKQMSRRGDNYM
jgi:hypothetical protein